MSAITTSANVGAPVQADSTTFTIREARETDFPKIWEIFQDILQKGGTYTLPADYPYENAKECWMGPEVEGKGKHYSTRVAVLDGKVVAAYAIRPCYPIGGPSSHVANASYIVHKDYRGKSIARDMGVHSFEVAKGLGYTKMQYNQMVSTNVAVLRASRGLGLEIVGRSPGGYIHKDGKVADLFIMNRDLGVGIKSRL